MKREDVELINLIKISGSCADETQRGIGVIWPQETIVGEAARVDGKPYTQPGIVPISLANLSAMTYCDLSNTNSVPLLASELSMIFDIHEDKSRGRRNERGALVNNLWGTLNPENFVVLYLLAQRLIKIAASKNRKFNCLVIGTGSGYPEVALVRLADYLRADIEVHTVDRGKGETVVPLDARNAAYGPEEVDGGTGCMIRAASAEIQSRIKVIEADSNRETTFFGKNVWDLIIVDGNHMYDAVYIDLLNSWSALAPGGVMFLDDFGGTKLATNGGVAMAAYHFAAIKRVFGYFVSSPADPFGTNSAFFVKDKEFEASCMPAGMNSVLQRAEAL